VAIPPRSSLSARKRCPVTVIARRAADRGTRHGFTKRRARYHPDGSFARLSMLARSRLSGPHPGRLAVVDDPGPRRSSRRYRLLSAKRCGARLGWSARAISAIGFDWIPLRAQFSTAAAARRHIAADAAHFLPAAAIQRASASAFLSCAAAALPPVWRIAMVIGAAATIGSGTGRSRKATWRTPHLSSQHHRHGVAYGTRRPSLSRFSG